MNIILTVTLTCPDGDKPADIVERIQKTYDYFWPGWKASVKLAAQAPESMILNPEERAAVCLIEGGVTAVIRVRASEERDPKHLIEAIKRYLQEFNTPKPPAGDPMVWVRRPDDGLTVHVPLSEVEKWAGAKPSPLPVELQHLKPSETAWVMKDGKYTPYAASELQHLKPSEIAWVMKDGKYTPYAASEFRPATPEDLDLL